VAVITTGSEVIDVDRIPGPGQIRNSNGFALAALIAESGAHLHAQSHIPDDPAETESALRSAAGLDGGQGADIIITAGGVSVGDKDYVKPALEKLGTLSFWRVKMKPGKPIAVGRIGQSIFFGLPGNPISAMVTYELFARPAIRKLAGHSDLLRPRLRAGLEGTIAHTPGREEYVRAVVSASETGLIAQPADAQGSGMLTSMVGANALIVVPADSGDIPSGSSVEVILLRLPGA
jgi:molybdopterin molybdotransferase